MCYDISYEITLESIEDYFGDLVFDDSQIAIEYVPMEHIQGVAVFPRHTIIYENRDDGKLHCRKMEWGIIRFFEKQEPALLQRNKMLNIRSERVLDDKASYWYKIRNRRCIIPLSAGFEHRAVLGWKKKVPYAFRPIAEGFRNNDSPVFGVPGLYSVAELPDKSTGELVRRWTFAMITTAANEVMQNIHNDGDNRFRMPLMIPQAMQLEYLKSDLSEERYHEILNYRIDSDKLEYWPVWTVRTGKLRPDGKCKTDFFEWPGLPALGEKNPPLP